MISNLYNLKKVRYSSLLLCFLCLLLASSPYLGQRNNNIIKLCIEMMVIIIVAAKYGLSTKILKKNVPIFFFFVTTCLSTYFYYGVSSRFFNAVVTNGAYLLFYLLIAVFSEKKRNEHVIEIIKTNIFIYMLILDFFVFFTNGKGLGGKGLGGSIDEAVYLLGNKFMTSYVHMIILAFINYPKNNRCSRKKKVFRIISFLLYSLIICKLTDTTTGMVGCVSVAAIQIILIYKSQYIQFLSNPFIVLFFFFGMNSVMLLTDFVLNNKLFTQFFLSRSHTNTILSGRVVMYNIAKEAIIKKPIWGYGINYDIVKSRLSFGNAQNGLLKMLMDYGIVGTILFSVVLFTTFQNGQKINDSNIKSGSIAFIYAMLFCSLVEVNLSSIFMLICALINGICDKNDEVKYCN